MKNLYTLSIMLLSIVQLSIAQDEAGFTPPEGSTFNEDSSVVTLPAAQVLSMYSEVISFFATDVIEVEGVDYELNFISATITGVTSTDGLDYDCNVEGCAFLPNTQGEVTLAGIPTTEGTYELAISAEVSVSVVVFSGLPAQDLNFSIPYTGGNTILDIALAGDYSALNSFIPTFVLNVEPAISVGLEEMNSLSDVSVYPNPASTQVSFEFTSANKNCQLQLFDLLGNSVYANSFSQELVTINTNRFNNGVYIYKLANSNSSSVGRLVVNK
jgi:hypothetical protein